MQAITILGVIFAVYLYFRKPQEKSEVNDAVFDVKFRALEDMVINLRDNHLHTLQSKLEAHISESQTAAIGSAEKMGRIEAKLDMLISKK